MPLLLGLGRCAWLARPHTPILCMQCTVELGRYEARTSNLSLGIGR